MRTINRWDDFNPREVAVDFTYSRLLTENFSVGITRSLYPFKSCGRFTGIPAQTGNSVAADIGVYYNKPIENAMNSTLSLGAQISNIGAKISYTGGDTKDFLPTTLRLGSAYMMELDPYNSITFTLDFSKLLVPTPPITDENGDIIAGKDPDRSLLSGMFGSFSDAPGGAKEEFKEVMISTGIEYWYNNTFAGRLGYFNEAKTKGNRKYLTVGVGFRKERFGIDVAYVVPTNKREHPLAETLRFTLLFQIDQTTQEKEESVTE